MFLAPKFFLGSAPPEFLEWIIKYGHIPTMWQSFRAICFHIIGLHCIDLDSETAMLRHATKSSVYRLSKNCAELFSSELCQIEISTNCENFWHRDGEDDTAD